MIESPDLSSDLRLTDLRMTTPGFDTLIARNDTGTSAR
jgi:hypothetical protein